MMVIMSQAVEQLYDKKALLKGRLFGLWINMVRHTNSVILFKKDCVGAEYVFDKPCIHKNHSRLKGQAIVHNQAQYRLACVHRRQV